METITKYFNTMRQAERYQNSLYNKFPYVRLVSFPSLYETGSYTWEVSM